MANKAGVLLGLGAVLAAGFLLFRGKKAQAAPPPEEEGYGALLDVAIYDEQGNRVVYSVGRGAVAAWDPSTGGTLNEGGTYTLVFSVKNISTKGGVAWPVSFDLYRGVAITGYPFPLEEFIAGGAFLAGETKTFSKAFTIPNGTGGASGYIKVQVFPAGALNPIIASSEKAFTVSSVAIIYGATIVIQPIA